MNELDLLLDALAKLKASDSPKTWTSYANLALERAKPLEAAVKAMEAREARLNEECQTSAEKAMAWLNSAIVIGQQRDLLAGILIELDDLITDPKWASTPEQEMDRRMREVLAKLPPCSCPAFDEDGTPVDDPKCQLHTSLFVNFPTIVTLCGSTRFWDAYIAANARETLAGKIVLSCGLNSKDTPVTEAQKKELDDLHLRKIDVSSEVFFLNVGGYMGESTRRELAYARARGKRIRFLEPERDP